MNKFLTLLLLLILITPLFAFEMHDIKAYNKLEKDKRVSYDAELTTIYADSLRLQDELSAKIDSLRECRDTIKNTTSNIDKKTATLCRQGNIIIGGVYNELLQISLQLEQFTSLSLMDIVTQRDELQYLLDEILRIERQLLPVLEKLEQEFDCIRASTIENIRVACSGLSSDANELRTSILNTDLLGLKSRFEQMLNLSDARFHQQLDTAESSLTDYNSLKNEQYELTPETFNQLEKDVFRVHQRIVLLKLDAFHKKLLKHSKASGLKLEGAKSQIYSLINTFRLFRDENSHLASTEFSKTEVVATQLLQRLKEVIATRMKRQSPDFIFVKGGEFESKGLRIPNINSFFIARWETTSKSYLKYCKATGAIKPTGKHKKGNYPITGVTWYDAIRYCNWLSMEKGLTPCYQITNWDKKVTQVTCDFLANGFRLPTSAEWLYAAAGGNSPSKTLYYGSDNINQTAWYKRNSKGKPHIVGSKVANTLGLYDMCGNVSEWCWDEDSKQVSALQSTTNPIKIGPENPKWIMGGHFNAPDNQCRKGQKTHTAFPDRNTSTIGFRLVRSIR
ncbi:MAG: formylglycine-generating enzyme family protein [Candidatus Cloacimonetes bacterium]|nr:formylglycine-generating enzyme family protein [Candidatus Cloacimonadota bacterium]